MTLNDLKNEIGRTLSYDAYKVNASESRRVTRSDILDLVDRAYDLGYQNGRNQQLELIQPQ